MKIVIAIVVVLLLAGGVGWWFFIRTHDTGPAFRTQAVARGELLATISATGTVEPEEVVDVGAQVAGQLLYFGKDVNGKPVDYGSVVDETTILAKIDDSLYSSQAASAQAALEQARANQTRDEADLAQKQALLVQAQGQWERAQKVGPSDALSVNDFETYRANFLTAQANVGVDVATIAQAKAAIDQAQAALDMAKENVGFCTVKSPVKGVIIDRRVNAGQTVVASLDAPSLFLIAKDLTRMQVWVSVNEADIGSIHPGQKVTFTVDAYPNDKFVGSVGRIRLNATMTQNVVTYTVEVLTDNSNGRLLPYLTANVQFEVADHQDALLVPNVALHWTPQAQQEEPEETPSAGDASAPPATDPTTKPGHTHKGGNGQGHGKVWIVDGAFAKPVSVRIGLSDGNSTEILGTKLSEGTQVIIGDNANSAASDSGTGNPFVPQIGQHRSGGH